MPSVWIPRKRCTIAGSVAGYLVAVRCVARAEANGGALGAEGRQRREGCQHSLRLLILILSTATPKSYLPESYRPDLRATGSAVSRVIMDPEALQKLNYYERLNIAQDASSHDIKKGSAPPPPPPPNPNAGATIPTTLPDYSAICPVAWAIYRRYRRPHDRHSVCHWGSCRLNECSITTRATGARYIWMWVQINSSTPLPPGRADIARWRCGTIRTGPPKLIRPRRRCASST